MQYGAAHSQLQGSQFNPQLSLLSMQSFACSCHVRVRFLCIRLFTPIFQKQACLWCDYSKPLYTGCVTSWEHWAGGKKMSQDGMHYEHTRSSNTHSLLRAISLSFFFFGQLENIQKPHNDMGRTCTESPHRHSPKVILRTKPRILELQGGTVTHWTTVPPRRESVVIVEPAAYIKYIILLKSEAESIYI